MGSVRFAILFRAFANIFRLKRCILYSTVFRLRDWYLWRASLSYNVGFDWTAVLIDTRQRHIGVIWCHVSAASTVNVTPSFLEGPAVSRGNTLDSSGLEPDLLVASH
jgi:hypothetical protein